MAAEHIYIADPTETKLHKAQPVTLSAIRLALPCGKGGPVMAYQVSGKELE